MHELLRKHFREGPNGVELLFFGSRIAMAIVDKQGNFVEVNGSFANFFGYLPAEIIGTDFANYTHPADLKGDYAAINDLLARRNGQTHYEMDKRYLHKVGGKEIWFHLSVDAVWDTDTDPCSSPNSFSHFFVVAQPHPNGGRYVKEERGGKVTVRPQVSLLELIKDNRAFFIAFIAFMAIFNPKILDLLIAIFK